MGIARTNVRAGICGHTARIVVEVDDMYDARLATESTCEKVRTFLAPVTAGNVLTEIGRKHETTLLLAARGDGIGMCPGCVVPAAAYKTMQAAAGLALPAPSLVEITVDE